MQKKMGRAVLAVPALAALMALAACGDRVENTEMPQPEVASVEINRQDMEGARQDTAAETRHGATAIMGGAGHGVAAGGVSLDARIATEVQEALRRDADLGAMKIDVSAQEGEVTLRGRAPDPAARDRAGQIARNIKDVRSVENQLTLG